MSDQQQPQINLPLRWDVARGLLGDVDEQSGYCRCPGADLHTHKSAAKRDRVGRDCRVYLVPSQANPRGVPSLKCVHSSCKDVVDNVQRELRSQIGKREAAAGRGVWVPPMPMQGGRRSKDAMEADLRVRKALALGVRAKRSLPVICADWAWDRADMWEASGPIPDDKLGQARALVGLFPKDDVVWCGEFRDSVAPEDEEAVGKERCERIRRCFRPCRDWLAWPHLPGPRICPNALKPGVLSKCDANVARRRFLVVEHDALGLAEQAAVLRWLWQGAEMRLRAVVFTGGKSLHGWFDCPLGEELKSVEVVLTSMGYDAASFRPNQPFRVPGWTHEKSGNTTELWFLEGGPGGDR